MRALPLLLLLVTTTGCYESFDGGTGPGPDATPLRDAGPIELDARPPVEPDADTAPERDAGPPEPSNVCEEGERLTAAAVPPCSDDTRRCIEACDDGGCQDSCLMEDLACVRCINTRLLACTNEAACQGQWDEFACCAEELCPGLTGVDRLNCSDPVCEPLVNGYVECVNTEVFACETEPSRCFR